ncbi:MAG: DUF2914 domain-containing protein [Acidobacteriota bacterium]
MPEKSRHILFLFILAALSWLMFSNALAQRSEDQSSGSSPSQDHQPQRLSMTNAIMCERVENLLPVRPAVAFSVSTGQVHCLTQFDPVPQPTMIYHKWYYRDKLTNQTKQRLYPPKWSTSSAIQLREADKGPWRVEITDQNGHIFDVLRFSITD